MNYPKQHYILRPSLLTATPSEQLLETFCAMGEAGIARAPYKLFDISIPHWCAMGDKSEHECRQFMVDNHARLLEIQSKFANNIRNLVGIDSDRVPDSTNDPARPVTFRYEVTGFGQVDQFGGTGDLVNALCVMRRGDGREIFPFGKEKRDIFKFGAIDLTEKPEHEREFGAIIDDLSESLHRRAIITYCQLIVFLRAKCAKKETEIDKLAKLGIGQNKGRYHSTTTIGIDYATVPDGHSGKSPRPHLRAGHVRRQRFGAELALIKPIFIEPTWVNLDNGEPLIRDHYNVVRDITLLA